MTPVKIARNRLLRKKVFERDQGICVDCGRFDPHWQHDHVVPLWCQGADTLDNSVTRCRHCHLRKTVGETSARAKTDRLRERHDTMKRRRGLAGRT